MSKKKKYRKPEVTKEVDYYKLKTDAVRALAEADESNSPEVPAEELRAYQSGSRFRIPHWAKIAFVKIWFPGAVCFFFIWGLGDRMATLLDLLFVTGIALGMVTDLLTNNVLRFVEKTPGENSRWMMFPKKGYISFPLNILYSYVVLFLVYSLYTLINYTAARITGQMDRVVLGVEPILFGVFYFFFDQLLIEGKLLLLRLIHGRAGKPAAEKGSHD